MLNVVAPDLQTADDLVKALRRHPEVDDATSVSDYVPDGQGEKLAILEDVAFFLAPSPGALGAKPPPSTSEQISALNGLRDELARVLGGSEDPELLQSSMDLHELLVSFLTGLADDPSHRERLAVLEESLLGSLPDQLDVLERALSAQPITLDTLPSGLLERLVTHSGQVRVQIFPAEDLLDPAALERFVFAVRSVAPDATGPATTMYESGRAVVRALQQAFVSALVMIAALLLLLWRAIDDTALVMAPLFLAGLFTAGTAVLVGIPLNFADVIVLPLLLGIGVDSGIHLVHRARMGAAEPVDLLGTSTARAVMFSATTTIASFGTLAFASHRGMASLGQLLTVGVAYTVVGNLILLPALITLRDRRAKRFRTRPGQTAILPD
jgi:hypothetical protein